MWHDLLLQGQRMPRRLQVSFWEVRARVRARCMCCRSLLQSTQPQGCLFLSTRLPRRCPHPLCYRKWVFGFYPAVVPLGLWSVPSVVYCYIMSEQFLRVHLWVVVRFRSCQNNSSRSSSGTGPEPHGDDWPDTKQQLANEFLRKYWKWSPGRGFASLPVLENARLDLQKISIK